MNDHDLDDRLRAGLNDLAVAAGEPPVWPDGPAPTQSNGTGRPLWHRALASAAVLAVVVGGLAVLARRGSDGVAEGPAGSAPFFGTRWYLSSATLDDAAVDLTPGQVPWVFGEENPCTFSGPDCAPGPMLLGRDGCNQFERSVNVDGDRVTWGEWGMTTAALCQGELQTAFDRLGGGDGFTFAIDGDTLRVSGSSVELVFAAGDSLGDPSGFLLDEGRAGDIAYRVTWNAGVAIEWVDTSTASMTNSQGYAATSDTLSGNFVDFGGPRYLFAILPDTASGAEYVTDNGDHLALTMLDHEGAPIVAASRLFESDPGPGLLVALDATGTVIASIPMIGADQPGLTSLPPTITAAPVITTSPPTTSPPTTSPPTSVPGTAECGTVANSPSDLTAEPSSWLAYGEYRRWTDVDGCPVRIDVISQTVGPDHCGWETVTFLTIGDPIGSSIGTTVITDARRFVWDPQGALPRVDDESRNEVVAVTDLPPSTYDAGYRDGTAELWLDPQDPTSLYRVDGAVAERYVADLDQQFLCS